MTTRSFTEAIRETLEAEMRRDRRIILMGEDIGAYGGAFGATRGLLDRFGPERVINTPISELSVVGAATGAAMTGLRPVVEIMFMDFLTLAMDPLVNLAAKARYLFGDQARCPLVIRTACGAGRGYGATHSQTLTAWLLHVPGIRIAAPSTPTDAIGLLKTALRGNDPVLFLEHKLLYGTREELTLPVAKIRPCPYGKARVVTAGNDCTLVAWSWMLQEALRAHAILSQQGIRIDVIDLRTLAPMDVATMVESVRRTGRLVIADEACRSGSVSAEIAARIFEQAHDYLDAPICRLTAPDTPIPAASNLEAGWMPSAADMVRAVHTITGR